MSGPKPEGAPITRPVTTMSFRASDGVDLTLYIHHPVGVSGAAPVALTMNPYTTVAGGDFMIQEVLDAGYVFVIMDVRGTGCSGGEFLGPLSPREIDDGVELVEWLADQDFCDGQVALVGPSYSGANQLLVAARRPRGLRCIAPTVAPIDFYRDWTHRGGIPGNHNWAAWTFASSPNQPHRSRERALNFYNQALLAEHDGPSFWERSPERVMSTIDVPVLLTGGLHDFFRRATLRAFEGVPSVKRLIFGPWAHEASDPVELVAWLDRWMRQAPERGDIAPTARWWVVGRDEWIEIDGLDAVDRHTLTIDGDVTVRADFPAITPPPSPTSDDFDAGTGTGLHLWPEHTRVEIAPVVHGVVRGCPVAELRVRVEGWTDADLNVRLSVMSDDGHVRQITEGRLRLSHRELDTVNSVVDADGRLQRVEHSYLNPAALSSGDDYAIAIELLPTCFELSPDERVIMGFAVSPVGGLLAHEGEVLILAGSALHLPIDAREAVQ